MKQLFDNINGFSIMRLGVVTGLLMIASSVFSQHANHWIFGTNVHLEFRGDSVIQIPITDIDVLEGTTAYADSSGNLVYYVVSDYLQREDHSKHPMKVYLPYSSTQGGLLLKHPESEIIHFSTSKRTGSIFKSLILNDSFILYRDRLPLKAGEKQNAVNHQNGRDIWYASHAQEGDSIYFFLIKKSGMIECPVVAHTGNSYEGGDMGWPTQGQMKFSPDGNYLAEATYVDPMSIGIYGFNSEFPQIDSLYVFRKAAGPPYEKRWPRSVEFAPDSQIIYVISGIKDFQEPNPVILYQLHLDSLKNDVAGSSWKAIDSLWFDYNGDLQIGPNGKIYLAMPYRRYLGVINQPNEVGSNCNFDTTSLLLDNGTYCQFGLPNFNQSYFYAPSIEFQYEEDCYSNTYMFKAHDTFGATSYQWRLTQLRDQSVETTTGKQMNYSFPNSDSLENKYEVTLIASNGSKTDSITKTITVRPVIKADFLGSDTFYCEGEQPSIVLKTPANLHCIHWNGLEPYSNFLGDTIIGYENFYGHVHDNQTFEVDTAGTYTVRITNKAFCQAWDTIHVVEQPNPIQPVISRNQDTLKSSIKAFQYHWYVDGNLLATTDSSSIIIDQNGEYELVLESEYGCQSKSEKFIVENIGYQNISLDNIKIYPNPNDGTFRIDYQGLTKKDIMIYNMIGQVVDFNIKSGIENAEIKLSSGVGSYLVTVRKDNGDTFTKLISVY